MADRSGEDQSIPTSGRLFSSSMFGFNKEEVLEYIEDLIDENYQSQEAAERRVQELQQRIDDLEGSVPSLFAAHESGDADIDALQAHFSSQLEAERKHLENIKQEYEISKAATIQAEEELQDVREQLYAAQQDNVWLQDQYQTLQTRIGQLEENLQNNTLVADGTDEQMSALQQQLEQSQQIIADLTQKMEESERLVDVYRRQAEHERSMAAATSSEDIQNITSQLQQAYEDITILNQQLDESDANTEVLQQQLQESTTTIAALQKQLQENKEYIETLELENKQVMQRNSSALLAEAAAEADRIRDEANADKERIHRQLRSSAGGIAKSVGNLCAELSDMEGSVTQVLVSVQDSISDVLASLARTEHNLSTLGIQVERFPLPAPTVPTPDPVHRPQQLVYFQPEGSQQITPAPEAIASQPASIPFKSVSRSFKPTYSNSPTAPKSSWPTIDNTHEIIEDKQDERQAQDLSDSLVETLRQMMD